MAFCLDGALPDDALGAMENIQGICACGGPYLNLRDILGP